MGSAPECRLWIGRAVARPAAAAALWLLASAASPAAAQTASEVLPPTREEVTRPEPQLRRDQAVRLDVEDGLERAPCALDSPEFKDIRFTVSGVEFEGLRGLPPEQLTPAYESLVGTQQPIAVVCSIRDSSAAILRDAGYIAAVEVPEQRIEDGVVRFRVIMAHLSQVRVRGDAGGAEKLIAGYLNRLTNRPVFNRFDAERYLLLASDLPGYIVRLTLRPTGDEPGEVFGDVTVQRTPVYADVAIQNGGSKMLGRWGGFGRVQVVGLTGLADRTTLAAFATADLKEQKTVQLGHDFGLGADGLRLGGFVTYGWANPSVPGDIEQTAETLVTTIQGDYPIVRSLARTLRGSLGLDFINQQVEVDSVPFSRDRLRVAFARLGFDAVSTDFTPGRSLAEPLWRFGGTVELRKGLDIFSATDPCPASGCGSQVPPSRTDGTSTAAVVRTLLYGEYRPVPKLTVAVLGRAQYAWDPLLSFELFAAGNYTAGRGYDPGSLLGDRGWGTQAEVRFGSTVPASARKPAVEGYLFFDHAEAYSADGPILPGRKHLNSAGVGARAVFDRFVLDAALAIPLTRIGVPEKRPDPRILVSLTTRLWPWSYE